MAACVLCRRPPRLHLLLGLRKHLARTQFNKAAHEDDKEEGRSDGDVSLPEDYKLNYNPSCYRQWNSTLSQSRTDNDDYSVSNIPPSFRQQCNHYSISSSRHISSGKKTSFDLASSTSPESKSPYLHHHGVPESPDVGYYPRAFLKSRPEYLAMTADPTQRPHVIKWEQASKRLHESSALRGSRGPADVTDLIVELSSLQPGRIPLLRMDKRFEVLLQCSVENLGRLSDLQLLDLLQSFVRLKLPSTHSVLDVYEEELCRRASRMDLSQLLLSADSWRCMGKQAPRFLQRLYEAVESQPSLTVSELVHLIYIIGESRHCPAELIEPLVQLLMCHLHQLLPEEVGAVCLGLFKSQTSISEVFALRIFDKAHKVSAEMSDYAVVNVFKYLRFSYLFHGPWMEAMTHEVPRRAHGMGVQGLMHVVLACSALRYRSDPILVAVAERIPSLVPHCRSKDSCKLIWSFGTLGFLPDQSPSLYPSLTQGLRQKKAEFLWYPEHLLTGLIGLAFVGQFPEDLISLALGPDFVKLALKSTQLELKKDLLTLDGALALELPHWTGPRLSPALRAEVSEMVWKNAQTDVCQKPEILEAESSLQDLLGGAEFVSKRMILPHTRIIDFEVHLDSSGQPVPLNQTSDPSETPLKSGTSTYPTNKDCGMINLGVTVTEDLIARLTNSKNNTDPAATASVAQRAPPRRVESDESLPEPGWHPTRDIVQRLTSLNRTVSEPPNTGEVVKLAVQVTTRNHFCCHSQQLMGFHAMKRRHLRLAGYRVVELNHRDWFPLLRKGRMEKQAYLSRKIFDSVT
ncbi:FAST kinase domain-containing protein 5, mitochondrial [Neosynchiropus ocellatus]